MERESKKDLDEFAGNEGMGGETGDEEESVEASEFR